MALYDDAAGRPIQKVFNRIGIRRDQNFADLSSPTAGLGNLIDTLIDDDENTFIAEDLGVINNIFSRGLTNSNYLSVAGSALRFVSPDGTREDYFDPRITYQNRLDKIQVFSGEPRLAGGNGLTAKYYQNDQITFDEPADFEYNANPNTTAADVFTGITTLGNLPDDNFWEEGDFSYTTKIHPQSVKSNTGVKWEGYFIPSITGPVEFLISSTGYFTVDINQEGYAENQNSNQTSASISAVGAGQTYKNYARVGVSTAFQVNSAGAGNVITVNTADVEKLNTIANEMSVTGSNIESDAAILSINRASDPPTIILTSDAANSVTGTFSNQTVTFSRNLSDSVNVTTVFDTQVLEAYQRYRIRIRYFHHKNFDSKDIIQAIDVNFRQRNQPFANDLRYTKLFSLDYNFTNAVKGDFNTYNDQSVLFGGTDTEGIGSRTDPSGVGYSKISTSNKVDIKYQPKQELGDGTNTFTGITRSQINVQKVAGSQILETGNSVLTTNIEVGNYIIGEQSTTNASVSFFARVSDLLENEFLVMDIPALAGINHTESVRFIDHRGFIRRVRVNNSSGTTITSSVSTNPFRGTQSADTNMTTIHKDVQVGMIAIGANIPAFTRVTAINSQTSLTLSASVSVSANQDVFFYDSKGLRDNSLQNFCDRIDNTPTVRCLISDVSSTLPVGTTVITVDDVKNVGVGWELQGSYFGENGITVSAVNSGTNQITLNSGIERSLPDNAQFTAVESGKSTGDYTLCCPPTDTSPPFDASEQGLDTISTHKDLGIESGNLKFDSLVLQDDEASNNATDLTVSQGTDVNRTIDIKTPSGTFKILATT